MFILHQAGRWSFLQDATLFQHVAPTGKLQRLADVLLDHQNRYAVVIDVDQYFKDIIDNDRRQAQGGFI